MKPIIFIIFFITFRFSFAQEKNNIQLESLKNKLTNIINDHRKSLKLKELTKDINIQKAAENQSNYLLIKRKLTHEQEDIKLKTPMDRVEFYAGKKFSLVGENVFKFFKIMIIKYYFCFINLYAITYSLLDAKRYCFTLIIFIS